MPDKSAAGERNAILTGTTLRVYRFLYRVGSPQGIHDIQRGLGLSSVSVADYHVKKLLVLGIVKEDGSTARYYVDRLIFENMVRIRKSIIPLQAGYATFFGIALVLLVTLLRPSVITGTYLFALIVIAFGVLLFCYQAFRTATSNSL